jgi:hypothetical protein
VSDLTNAIRSKGYWRIDIHPTDYVTERVPYVALKSTLERTVVRLRGWDLPHFDRQGTERRGNNWIGSETEWNYVREAWRFYQSGQFVYMRGMIEDWIEPDRIQFGRIPLGVPSLGVGDALFTISEIFEFASRLSVTDAGADQMRVEIDLRNVAGRHLYVDDVNRMRMDNQYSFHDAALTRSVVVSRADAAGRSRELALDMASDIFGHFGWHPDRALLQGQQDELRW